jgi:hypothetical protein
MSKKRDPRSRSSDYMMFVFVVAVLLLYILAPWEVATGTLLGGLWILMAGILAFAAFSDEQEELRDLILKAMSMGIGSGRYPQELEDRKEEHHDCSCGCDSSDR